MRDSADLGIALAYMCFAILTLARVYAVESNPVQAAEAQFEIEAAKAAVFRQLPADAGIKLQNNESITTPTPTPTPTTAGGTVTTTTNQSGTPATAPCSQITDRFTVPDAHGCTGKVQLFQHGGTPCKATFVDNEGTRSPKKSPLKIDGNKYVFGVASDWYKMVAVDASGAKIETRYMQKDLTLTKENWDAAKKTTAGYKAEDVEMCNSFTGWSAAFAKGAFDMNTMVAAGAKNDDVSSLKVPARCKAILFQNGNFEGWSAEFPAGEYPMSSLASHGAKNDDVSSLKVLDDPGTDFAANDAAHYFRKKTDVVCSTNATMTDAANTTTCMEKALAADHQFFSFGPGIGKCITSDTCDITIPGSGWQTFKRAFGAFNETHATAFLKGSKPVLHWGCATQGTLQPPYGSSPPANQAIKEDHTTCTSCQKGYGFGLMWAKAGLGYCRDYSKDGGKAYLRCTKPGVNNYVSVPTDENFICYKFVKAHTELLVNDLPSAAKNHFYKAKGNVMGMARGYCNVRKETVCFKGTCDARKFVTCEKVCKINRYAGGTGADGINASDPNDDGVDCDITAEAMCKPPYGHLACLIAAQLE